MSRLTVRHALVVTCALLAGAPLRAQSSVDRQFWTDFVPQWRVNTRTTFESEFSFRTAWQGAAPTQYWSTNTLEWNARPWLAFDAIGAVVESRGPSHGSGYFELRPAGAVRLTWRGTRVRASEVVRFEHRMLYPLGSDAQTIERIRHREQVLVALNHPSMSAAHTAYLIADAEWFLVHGDQGGWVSNQLRARAGLGYRLSARRSFEAILNDTRRRGTTSLEFEDGDHVLRLRWKESFGR